MSRPRVKAKNNPSPGLGGAIKDAVAAVAKATSPKSVSQRKQTLDAQESSVWKAR